MNWGPLRPERSALPGCATPRAGKGIACHPVPYAESGASAFHTGPVVHVAGSCEIPVVAFDSDGPDPWTSAGIVVSLLLGALGDKQREGRRGAPWPGGMPACG